MHSAPPFIPPFHFHAFHKSVFHISTSQLFTISMIHIPTCQFPFLTLSVFHLSSFPIVCISFSHECAIHFHINQQHTCPHLSFVCISFFIYHLSAYHFSFIIYPLITISFISFPPCQQVMFLHVIMSFCPIPFSCMSYMVIAVFIINIYHNIMLSFVCMSPLRSS